MDALAMELPHKSNSDPHWVRAYFDAQHGRTLALFAAPWEAAAMTTSGLKARRVVELQPAEYL